MPQMQEVVLPDGTIITDVPEDMTQEELISRLQAGGIDTSWYQPPNPDLSAPNSEMLSQMLQQDVQAHPTPDLATQNSEMLSRMLKQDVQAHPKPQKFTPPPPEPMTPFDPQEHPELFENAPEGPKTEVDRLLMQQSGPQTSVKQPLTPEFRQQVQNAWDAASPEQRAQMEQTPGAVGALAAERRQAFEQQDTTGLQAAQQFDPRAEKRAGQIASQYQGIDPNYAMQVARSGAAQGVTPGAEVQEYNQTQQQIGPSNFDWNTYNQYKDTPSAPGYKNIQRGAHQAYLGSQQAINGMMQMAFDVTGADKLANRTQQYGDYLTNQQQSMGEASTYGGKIVENSVNSILQQLPFMVLSGGTSELVPLAGAAVTTFGQEYSDGKAQGQDTTTALERASLMAAFEVIGEKFGLAERLGLLKEATKGMGSDEAIALLKNALYKEVPGEILTSTGQFLTDKVPGGLGLQPDATFEDYVEVVKDTIATTLIQSAIMGGGAATVGGVSQQMQNLSQQRQERGWAAESAREAEDTRQEALNKWQESGLTRGATSPLSQQDKPTLTEDELALVRQLLPQTGAPTDESARIDTGFEPTGTDDTGAGASVQVPSEESTEEGPAAEVAEPEGGGMGISGGDTGPTGGAEGREPGPLEEDEFQLTAPPSETKVSTGPREFPLYTDQELAEKKAQEEKEKAETAPTQQEEADEIRKKLGYDKLETEGSLVVDLKKRDKVAEDIIVGNIEAEIDRNGKATRKLYFHFSDPAAEMYTTNVVNNLKAKYNVTPSTEAPGLYDLTRKTEKVELPPAIAKHATAALTAMSQSTTKTGAVDKLVQSTGITKTKANQVINGLIAQGMILKEGNKYRLSDTGHSYIATPTTTKKAAPKKKTEVPLESPITAEELKKQLEDLTQKEKEREEEWKKTNEAIERFKQFKRNRLRNALTDDERYFFDFMVNDAKNNPESKYKGYDDENLALSAIEHVKQYGKDSALAAERMPVPVGKRITKATNTLKTGNTGEALKQLEDLNEEIKNKALRDKLKRELLKRDPQRGYKRVSRALEDAKDRGIISKEAYDIAMWLLNKNPLLAEELAIYIGRPRNKSESGVSGRYTPTERIIKLFRGITGKVRGDLTPVHEILHHIELLMPEDIRAGIRKAWADAVKDLYQMASDTGNTKLLTYISHIYDANVKGDEVAHLNAMNMIRNSELPRSMYRYLNPSEYWAENASELVASRQAANTWGKKAIQWIKELIEHLKKVFGLSNTSEIIKGLNEVIKVTSGETKGESFVRYGEGKLPLEAPRQRGTRKQVKERAGERKLRTSKDVTENYIDPLRLLKEAKSWRQFKVRFRAAKKAGKVHSLRGLANILPMHQIMDLISDEIPEFHNTLEIKTNLDAYKNRRIKEDTKIAEGLRKFYNDTLESDGMYALADACHIATLNNVDFSAYENRDEALAKDDDLVELRDSYRNASLKGKVDLQRQITRRENEIKEAYKAWNKLGIIKNGEGRKLWKQMLEKYKADFKEHIDLLIELANNSGLEGDINDETSEKGQLRAAIQARFYRNKKIPVYFPLMRFGPYWARLGKGAGGTTVMFNSSSARNAYVDEMLEKKLKADNKVFDTDTEFFEALDNLKEELKQKGVLDAGDGVRKMRNVTKEVSGNELLKDIFNMIDKSAQPGAPVINKEVFKDAVFQLFFQTLPDRDIRSRYAKRVGKAGFAADVMNNFSVISNTTANQLGRLKYEGLLRKSIDIARESIKSRPDTLELAPYIDEMEKRLDIEMGVFTQGIASETLENLARWGNKITFYTMLTKPKQMFIQLTQFPVVGLTVLIKDYTKGPAIKTFGRYLNIINKIGNTEIDPDTGLPVEDPLYSRTVSIRNSKYLRNKMLLKHVYDWADTNLNYFSSTRSADMYERSETPTKVMEGKVAKGTRIVSNILSGFIHHGERLSREAMLMASFELALQKRLEEAKQAARDEYEKAHEEVAKWRDVDEADRAMFADDIDLAIQKANYAYEQWKKVDELQLDDLYQDSPQLVDALIELNQIEGAIDLKKKAKGLIASLIEKARIDALKSADDALFNYSRFNKPRVMGTSFGSTAFKFMMFPISMTGKLAVATYNVFKKRIDLHLKDHYKKAYDAAKKNGLSDAAAKATALKEEEATKKKLRKEVRDATIMLFGVELMQFMFGGLEGAFLFHYAAGFLTHIRDAFWWIYTHALGGDDDDDDPKDLINPLKPYINLKDWMLLYYIPHMFGNPEDPFAKKEGIDKTLKQSVQYGPISALTGWYIGASTSLNNMYFMDDINTDKAADAVDLTVYRMATGAVGATANQYITATDLALSQGEWGRAMEKMPSVFGTTPKMIRHAMEGERNIKGVQKKSKDWYTMGKLFGDFVGLNQVDLAENQKAQSLAFKQSQDIAKIRDNIYDKAYKALQEYQRTKKYAPIREVIKLVKEYNSTDQGKLRPIEGENLKKSVLEKAKGVKKEELTGIPSAIDENVGLLYQDILKQPKE